MYSQSIVTKGLTGPTFLNHLSTQPVHIPLVLAASLTAVSGESCGQFPHPHSLCKGTVHKLRHGQGQGSKDVTTPWRVKCIWSKTLLHLIPGDRSCAHPQPAVGSGMRVKRNAELTQRLQGHQGHHQGESQQTWQSSSQRDAVHKRGHWFPIIGKNYYSINHNRKMGCFREKWGLFLHQKLKKF